MNDEGQGLPPVPFGGMVDEARFRQVMYALMPRWVRWYTLAPACTIVLITVNTGWARAFAEPASLVTNVLLGLATAAGAHVATRLQFRRAWQTFTRLHGSVAGQVDGDGLARRTDASSTRLGWGKIIGYRFVGGDLALVHYGPRSAFFLPRGFFASDGDWAALHGALARYSKPL